MTEQGIDDELDVGLSELRDRAGRAADGRTTLLLRRHGRAILWLLCERERLAAHDMAPLAAHAATEDSR